MKNLKNIIFIVLLIFLFVEVLIIFPNKLEQQETQEAPAAVTQNDPSQPDQKAQGIHLVETQQGSRDWELFSQVAEGYQGKSAVWELQNVKVLFYNKEKDVA